MTQVLTSAPRSALATRVRDGALMAVPHVLNTWAFDRFLAYSSP
jgi:hypothetical protein